MRPNLCRATRDERRRTLPGDAIVAEPMFTVTHAITIDAPAARVWPWLVQMGSDRAGWYSYDAIDNGLRPSARHLVHELQTVQVGDVFPVVPGDDTFVVAAVEPGRALILSAPGRAGGAGVSWEHRLEPLGPDRCRLIARGRVARTWRAGSRVAAAMARLPRPVLRVVAGAGHWIMDARHLRGIRDRAERGRPRARA
jgi:hypothetical protein